MLFKLQLISHFCCCCVTVVVTFVFIYFLFCCWLGDGVQFYRVDFFSLPLQVFVRFASRLLFIFGLHLNPIPDRTDDYATMAHWITFIIGYVWFCCFFFVFWCVLNFIIVIGSGSIFFLFLFGSVCVQFYIYFPSYCCCLLYFSSFESCFDLFLSFTCACVAVVCWYLCLVFWPNSTKQICKPNKCMTKQI